ncbi:hypothetical protein L1887_11107 [Cichorium endivia]|nr:hypothetical protein L1887_11107 [Cichorium endivia]
MGLRPASLQAEQLWSPHNQADVTRCFSIWDNPDLHVETSEIKIKAQEASTRKDVENGLDVDEDKFLAQQREEEARLEKERKNEESEDESRIRYATITTL